ncbi:MAG TPA: hypothetical protein ACQGQH_01180 [Xylella sp.]
MRSGPSCVSGLIQAYPVLGLLECTAGMSLRVAAGGRVCQQ